MSPTPAVPDSPLGRWDARWKLGGLVLLAAAASGCRTPAAAAGCLAVAVILAAVGRVPARDQSARGGLVLLAVAPVLAFLPFTGDLPTAAAFALRLLALGLVALTLSRTTTVSRLFSAVGAVGVPAGLVTVGLLAHRYTALIGGELARLRRAWRVRGFRPGTNLRSYRVAGQAVGVLAVRADDRAERVAAALRVRGFDGTVRPLDPFRTRPADVFGFAGCGLAAAGLVALDRWGIAWTRG